MNYSRTCRSFKHLGFSILIFVPAMCGAHAMTRAPDSAAVVHEQQEPTATYLKCGASSSQRCPLSRETRFAGDLAAPVSVHAPVDAVRTAEITVLQPLPLALQLQWNLFADGGRLTLVDMVIAGSRDVRPAARTAKAPDWAM